MLLHARLREPAPDVLYVRGDPERIEVAQREVLLLAPHTELSDRLGVGAARVGVANVGTEEFDELPRRSLTGVRKDGRDEIEHRRQLTRDRNDGFVTNG